MTTQTLTLVKNLSYIPALIIGAGISVDVFLALAMLVLIDTFTGILKTGVVHGWQKVKSGVMANGIIAKLVLILIPIVLALLTKATPADVSILVHSALSVLILSEGYSIIGNIHSIKTKKDVPEFDAVAYLLKVINKLLNKLT